MFNSDGFAGFVDCLVPIYALLTLAVLSASYKENSYLKQRINSRIDELSKKSASSAGASKATSNSNSRKSSSSSSNQTGAVASQSESSASGKTLTGSFKLYKNANYQKFLEVQGVGWALRKGRFQEEEDTGAALHGQSLPHAISYR